MIQWSRLKRSSLLKCFRVISWEKCSRFIILRGLRRFASLDYKEIDSRRSNFSGVWKSPSFEWRARVRVSWRMPPTSLVGTECVCPARPPCCSCNLRLFSTEKVSSTSRGYQKQLILEAQAAVFDYLYSTRGLDFSDAEYVSKNSPIFLGKILKKAGNEGDVGNIVRRFLRYHPINEFEPFFESLGLKPRQYKRFLPKDLIFLSDDELLMMNFHLICSYGVPRAKIGKICCEATEVFRYERGVLASKLKAYEDIGISKAGVINLVSSSPPLLIGDVSQDFVQVAEEVEDLGLHREWIAENVGHKKSYHWGRMIMLLRFLSDLGLDKSGKANLIMQERDCLLDGSGIMAFGIIVLLTKLGATRANIETLFLQFPPIHAGNFLRNMQKGLQFLVDIDMNSKDIGMVMLFRPQLLGSCSLLKPGSALKHLAVGKNRLCEIIRRNPDQLLCYTKGSNLEPLVNSEENHVEVLKKKEFLSILGYVDNTKEMEKALKIFRGKAEELQNGYDYLTTKGLDSKDITKMLTTAPLVLRQKLSDLKSKVEFLTGGMGYPVESLVMYPNCLLFSLERLKVRFLMYKWLKSEGKAKDELAWATILKCSDELFVKTYVNRHPQGAEVWDKFRRAIYTC